jgi:3'-5' exoribonuclease
MVQAPLIRFADLSVGERISGIVCAWSCSPNRTRNDLPFLRLELRDAATMVLQAVMWDVEHHQAPECPAVVYIQGDVNEYRGELQIRINSMETTGDAIDLFVPTTYRPAAELADELTGIIELISDSQVRSLVEASLREAPRFWTAPAAIKFHGAYRGGLLEHTLHVSRICLQAADIYAGRVNPDLLLAGAILHDIGKHDAYDSPESREPVEVERLVGHILRGAMLVERTAEAIDYQGHLPIHEITHMILSHHGELQFGAPVEPATVEALILSAADRLDADATGLFDLWRDQVGTQDWTYSGQRQRWVRRPGSTASGGDERSTRHNEFDDLPF